MSPLFIFRAASRLKMTDTRNHTKNRFCTVRRVPRGSPLYRAGVRSGDKITAVNGQRVADELDFRFHAASPRLQIALIRNGALRTVGAERAQGSFLNIEFHEKAIRRCVNRCIFCFIDQMPPGLRKRLYIKDEDLTHSFLNGNYITLTNASDEMLQRVVRLGLSPLFISVHATDPVVRRRMFGVRRRLPPIMDQLGFLAHNGIRLHTQIVVCPGYNDGAVLASTVAALLSFGPESMLSIAVVPVGLTRFRRQTTPLAPVDRAGAEKICRTISAASDRDRALHGKRRLFLSDEFFLRAGYAIPPAAYYEDYPQIGNGVGLVRQMLDVWDAVEPAFSPAGKRRLRLRCRRKKRLRIRQKKYLLLTSQSAFPFIRTIAAQVQQVHDKPVHVEPVTNRFFGETVTVAGLLTAQDAISAIRKACRAQHFDSVLLPAVMFNYAGYTLDGWSAKRIAKRVSVPVQVLDSIEELRTITG
jgi:putative radical SAM enzyme (TIGR03279 family)